MESGYIFDIQNCSLHDGPGLRTTVFFKGCPLRCLWCSNPESQALLPQIMFYKEKCTGCGKCQEVCQTGAVKTGIGCMGCGKCVESCVHNARKLVGRKMTSADVIDEVLRDKLLYERSCGGVTLSGGEVLMQPIFAQEILKGCQAEGIHTLLDTSAYCDPCVFREVVQCADMVYIDMKAIDPEKHRQLTGVSNHWILENLAYLDQEKIQFSVRMPIIPGYNDTSELIDATMQYLKKLKSDFTVYLLPFHAFGKTKYERIGMTWKMGNLKNLERDALNSLLERFQSAGLHTVIQ